MISNWSPGDWLTFLAAMPIFSWIGFRLGHAYVLAEMRHVEERLAGRKERSRDAR
jgi:hypothetical protein